VVNALGIVAGGVMAGLYFTTKQSSTSAQVGARWARAQAQDRCSTACACRGGWGWSWPAAPQEQQRSLAHSRAPNRLHSSSQSCQAAVPTRCRRRCTPAQAELSEQLGKEQAAVGKLRKQADEAAAAVARERQLADRLREEGKSSVQASRWGVAALGIGCVLRQGPESHRQKAACRACAW
jgi:hypothetical protein